MMIMMLLATSCQEKKESTRSNTQICDYFYGVEYDDYDFETCVEIIGERFCPQAACSEVRKGNFVGRNLDWYINCDAAFVVKVNASDKRYASIGMAGCLPLLDDSLAASGEPSEIYEALPMMTVDGVNEKGLYVGVNVMPTGETSLDESHWKSGSWGVGAAFTNPGAKKTYCVVYLVRYLLDHASSLAEAKSLVESVNWYEPMNFPHEGETQSFHWLIADATSNAVLEFLDNKPCFTETTEVREPSYATIMTNFTNKLMADEQLVQTMGCGYERWDILHDNYAETEESFEGMISLMQKVWYTNAYTMDLDENFWFTEFTTPEFPAYEMRKPGFLQEHPEFAETVSRAKATFAEKANWHTPTSTLWYSTHSVVYDLSKRELRVMTHEGLDGQKEYYAASLSESTFEKPLK